MTRTTNKLFLSFAIFCSAFMLQTAHAEQPLVLITTPDQFVIQLPGVDREALIERVRTLRSQLIQRKQALVKVIADKKMDSSDTVIASIMPGGLIYAAYKKTSYEQSRNELAGINADIEECSDDLLAMQAGAAPVFVARLQ
jgi:hypothetical protein